GCYRETSVSGIICRIVQRPSLCQGVQFGFCALSIDSRGKPSDGGAIVGSSREPLTRWNDGGYPYVGVLFGKVEARGHHAEPRVLSSFNSKRAAHYRRIRSEATVPQPVTEDDDTITTCRVIFRKKRTAQQWRYPE